MGAGAESRRVASGAEGLEVGLRLLRGAPLEYRVRLGAHGGGDWVTEELLRLLGWVWRSGRGADVLAIVGLARGSAVARAGEECTTVGGLGHDAFWLDRG